MKLSIATYATSEINSNVIEFLKDLYEGKLIASYPLTDSINFDDIILDGKEWVMKITEKSKAQMKQVPFHGMGVNIACGETCYGEAIIASFKTSTNNTLVIASCDYNDEQPVLCIGYDGSRGGFVTLLPDLTSMSVDELPKLINDMDDDLLTYESTGPVDMLPWETKYTYVTRVGGDKLWNAVREAVEELCNASDTNVFKVDYLDGETSPSKHYVGTSSIGANNNAILDYWINDDSLTNRLERVTLVENIINLEKVKRSLINTI